MTGSPHQVIWKVKGGSDRLDNLALPHSTCHRRRITLSLDTLNANVWSCEIEQRRVM